MIQHLPCMCKAMDLILNMNKMYLPKSKEG